MIKTICLDLTNILLAPPAIAVWQVGCCEVVYNMPNKQTIIFSCSKCGAQYPKWQGRCSECGNWGTISEEMVMEEQRKVIDKKLAKELIDLSEIKRESLFRIKTNLEEFDRVVGGGMVAGSLILLGGEPGIGKSTLALQLAYSNLIFSKETFVLYVSSEESAEQVDYRLSRLKKTLDKSKIKFLNEDNIEVIIATIEKNQPGLVIIDSIQTVYNPEFPSEAGSLVQVKSSAVRFLEIAKKLKITIILIGHVTKEGIVAGPKSLEHLVDTVLYLEGDNYQQYRLLRTTKNRFGSVGEIGVFAMTTGGLIPVKNPSEVFISSRGEHQSGSIITPALEGNQIFLVEIQALVSKTSFGYPKRTVSGFDLNRLELLAAVLTKKTKINLSSFDIYLNLTGGFKLKEPSLDLPVCLAIISSFFDKILPKNLVAFGEVGLGGEIRTVAKTKERIKESLKLGFNKIILADFPQEVKISGAEIIKVKNLNEVIEKLFL